MNATTYNTWHPRHLGPVIVFSALISGLLFAALPWLTRVADREPGITKVPPYIILPKTQPRIPEPERDRRIIDQDLLPPPKPSIQPKPRQENVLDLKYVMDNPGDGVPVMIIDAGEIVPEWKEIVFDSSQLDKAPRVIRRVRPAYPFAAKRQGIKARVTIRCLVDKDGNPQNVIAAECDPEDVLDVFGPPSVEAVKKWRFSPGEIDGDPVPTKVAFHLFFELD